MQSAEEVFLVEDGTIRIMGEPLGYMYTEKRYRNFTLSLEYRWADGESNSGVFVLIDEPLNPFPKRDRMPTGGRQGRRLCTAGRIRHERVYPSGGDGATGISVIERSNHRVRLPAGEWNQVRWR